MVHCKLAGTFRNRRQDRGSGPVTGTRVVGFSTRMEGWAEYVAVSTSYLAPIPDDVRTRKLPLPVAGLTLFIP